MSRMRWDKVGFREPDPGKVTILSEDSYVDPWVTPQERLLRKAKKAKKNEQLLQRSEQLRYKAMLKKFGELKAISLGVPRSFVEKLYKAKTKARQKQLRAEIKNARRKEKQIKLLATSEHEK